jgi:transposase
MNIPWSKDLSRFTKSFEVQCIELLKGMKNRSKVAQKVGLSWDQITGIMNRSVERGLGRLKEEKVVHLGIDEKNYLRGQSYATVLTDTEGKRVLEVVQGRDIAAMKGVFSCLTAEQKEGVRAIGMDFGRHSYGWRRRRWRRCSRSMWRKC